MRLMIIGRLDGHISQAGKIALQRGAKVVHCEDIEQAMGALLNGKSADLAMVDVKQKIGDFVERLSKERIHMPVVACGIGTDARSAVKAIQQGAKEYVPLPPDPELIAAVIEAVTEENNSMIANDPSMKAVVALADKIAPSEATVMITGESGTGKEVMSRYLHNKSKRKDAPFIAVNCAAIPENLLESELFGHEKGAFTGANQQRQGRFEQANGGTLFLDEIGDMPMEAQTRLLRVLADGEFYRVGGHTAVKVDVRIIAATHQNLEKLVEDHRFREDLFHRLNVIRVQLPALAERKEDVPALADHFLQRAAKELAVETKVLTQETADYLMQLNWPGNVRQLENLCRWLTVMASSREIHRNDLPPDLLEGEVQEVNHRDWRTALRFWADNALQSGETQILTRAEKEFEQILIDAALAHTGGRKQDAAQLLGWGRNTLTRKLKAEHVQ